MHELNEIARKIPNMGFAIFGIYMAHSLYKTPRKIYQCVFAWLSVYAFWIAIGIPLPFWFPCAVTVWRSGSPAGKCASGVWRKEWDMTP